MNKVILVGNLTRDPELSVINSGIAVCKMGLAVNRTFANANGEREVDFFNLVAWRGLGENCNRFLKKGSKVAVSGNIQTRNYEDKDGIKRTAFDIVADDIEFLSSRTSEGGQDMPSYSEGGQKPKAKVKELQSVDDDDDLPF